MITKDKLIQSIQDLPDKFPIDDLIDRVILLHKIETGIEQSETGQTQSTKEAKKKLKKWIK
ncbi:MAG: hypothetical protein EA408_12560 [Marinilabiliales bacterium]|nr:MAG: hypothetical protein EA408_12560 [Marinilabiliales bacterium]